MIPLNGWDVGVVPKLLARVDIVPAPCLSPSQSTCSTYGLGLLRRSFPSLDEGDEVRGVVDVLFEREEPVAGVFEPSPVSRCVIHSVA